MIYDVKRINFVFGLCLILLVIGVFQSAFAAKDHLHAIKGQGTSKDPILSLTLGKAEIYNLKGDVADILVADPSVADVMAVQSDRLYIVGSKLGDTNIIALDESGNIVSRFNVHVRIDTDTIENMVHELFPNEKDVSVRATTDQVYLSGRVSSPVIAQKIASLVAAHVQETGSGASGVDGIIQNLLEVDSGQQVMLRVRVMEIERSVIKELGLETSANDPLEGAANLLGGLPFSSLSDLGGQLLSANQGLSNAPQAAARLLWDTDITGIGFLELAIDALEQENLVSVLAEPNLTAISGEQAGFLAGGEFPVPVGRDREGNIILEFKEFGVSLDFVPTVLSKDRISLQLETEVSSLDFGQGITLADVTVPGLDVRRASTTVELGSGNSIMIAGLLQSDTVKGFSGLPGIKDTPILGDLVSSRQFSKEETEMVVMITPYLVEAFADKKQAKKVTRVRQSPLSSAFANNLKRNYGANLMSLPDQTERFGYIIN